ncbi:MAG TPA: CBS domain-containing protein [Candidatus Eremiobacteraeota bacterium]|nr:MAG: CCA-adding enzyme [bacterium ADurb.Bin363]HPZ07352.1 CBS domain-containing protein [Candidatus Eremiobacteraeota bacterium]
MEIIACHNCTDFDTFASMIAAKKIYPEAKLVFSGSFDVNVKKFMTFHRDLTSSAISFKKINPAEITKLIIVDTRLPDRLGPLKKILHNPGIEIHIYDHHPYSQEDIVGTINVIKGVGAATTLLVEIIKNKNISIRPTEATLFALGIYEDTGSLTFPGTTYLDVDMVSFLLTKGARLEIAAKYMNQPLSEEQRKLLNQLILSSKTYNFNGLQIVISTSEVEKYIPKLAILTYKLIELDRKDAFFTIVRMKNKIYIVARSLNYSIDANLITRYFKGGGHMAAASAMIKETDIKKITEKLLDILNKNIKPSLVAQDIMSFPVKTVESNLKVGEAIEIIKQHGHSGLIIEQEGELCGVISLGDLRKALEHNLQHAPVKAYMTRDFVTAPPDMAVSKLQELMVEKQVGRIPILSEKKLVGVVTRTDIIRTIHSNKLLTPHQFPTRLEDMTRLSIIVQTLLRKAGKIGDREKIPVYAVGGFVRDLLLGIENFDLDLVVEGDGINYAQKLAASIGGELKIHPTFGTAELIIPGGYSIDVASARAEFYTQPGALPKIRYSSIKQDLIRRDFTINTLALGLNSDNFGQIIDFFRGEKDLESGLIRILHNLSFIDDPTRIFRAIKFEQRYYFTIEPHTERLIKTAVVSNNILDKISRERFLDELIMLLNEKRPVSSILRMDELGILKTLHPKIKINREILDLLNEVSKNLSNKNYINEEITEWLIYFLAFTKNLLPEETKKIAKNFKFKSEIIQKLTYENNSCINLGTYEKLLPSEIYRELSAMSTEFLFYIMSQIKNKNARRRIINYLTKWRNIKPLINGKDLIDMGYKPGPFFGQILSIIKNAQLDKIINSREEAKSYGKNFMEIQGAPKNKE